MIDSDVIRDQIPIQVKEGETPTHLSSEVFEGYLKWTAISLLTASLISIVMFVLLNATYTTTQSLSGYSTLSRYFLKTTLLAIYETVEKCDTLTPGYWCNYPIQTIEYFVFQPSNGKFSNPALVNKLIANHTTQSEICYYFNTFKIRIGDIDYNARQIKILCYVMDGLIVFCVFILLVVSQYRAEERHSGKKKYMIDKFSVRITNLPPLPKHQLLVKLKNYMEGEVEEYLQSHPINQYKFQIFDINTNLSQQSPPPIKNSSEDLTQDQLEKKLQQDTVSRRADQQHAEVWVTFATKSNRKLVMNIFKMSEWYMRLLCCFLPKLKRFQNCAIEVGKPPHPEDIIFKNLSVTNRSRLIVRIFIYFVSLCLLVVTTFLLLFLKRLSSIIVSSVAVLTTNILAQMILVLLSKYERHALITNENVSNINKTAIYKFINTGLVVFLSQFRVEGLLSYFSNYFNYFTNQEFSSVTNSDWILNTGLSIVYTMVLEIVVSNFKMLAIFGVYYWKLWRAHKKGKPGQTFPHIQMPKLDGYSLYAEMAAVMMIILSYSYLLPILYPIGFLILFTNYCTYSYVKKYTVFPCDSFNGLTKAASSLTLLAITLHMGVIAFIEDSDIHLGIACLLGVLYIFRVFLMKLVMGIIHIYKRASKLKKQSKIREREVVKEEQFSKLLSEEQRLESRVVLKSRRVAIQSYINQNPSQDHQYRIAFLQFLKYQRDVIKFSPKIEGHIIGATTYFH